MRTVKGEPRFSLFGRDRTIPDGTKHNAESARVDRQIPSTFTGGVENSFLDCGPNRARVPLRGRERRLVRLGRQWQDVLPKSDFPRARRSAYWSFVSSWVSCSMRLSSRAEECLPPQASGRRPARLPSESSCIVDRHSYVSTETHGKCPLLRWVSVGLTPESPRLLSANNVAPDCYNS